jgi:hypothetical protein
MLAKCSRYLAALSPRWLLAAAVLIAAGMGGIFPAAAAGVCAEKAQAACARPGGSGWTTVLVEVRERKAQLEAIRFAERVKRHLGRQFAKRKVQFEKSQVRLERQRRVHKRHAKAQQFAEARRHVARHMHRLQPAAGGHLRRFVHNAPRGRKLNGGNVRHVLSWRALWRHNAHNDVQPQQQAN